MKRTFTDWLARKWVREPQPSLPDDYRATFSPLPGQRVLRHLLDGVYCTVYEGHDPIEAAHHNGRRSVVQEILENIDLAENLDKYRIEVPTEGVYASSR